MHRLHDLLANPLANFFSLSSKQGWEVAGWTMCYFLAAGTVVVLCGALLRLLCRQAGPQVRYLLSLAIFATLAALPCGISVWLSQGLPTESQRQLSRAAAVAVIGPITPQPRFIDLKAEPLAPQNRQLSTASASVIAHGPSDFLADAKNEPSDQATSMLAAAIWSLPWVWIVGTPLTFLLLTTGLVGSQRLRKSSVPIAAGPIFEAYRRLGNSLRVSQQVSIALCDRIASPLLIGVVRPLILLPPAALTGWSPEELEMVLLHELAHIRRCDNLVNFLQRIVESLLFFHPAVWWASQQVRRDREECCDAVVVAHTARPQAYAELLITLAAPAPPLAGLAMARHPLAGRIRRILKLEDEAMFVSRTALGIVGLSLAAVLSMLLWQQSTTTFAKEAIPAAIQEKNKRAENGPARSVELPTASSNENELGNTSSPSPFLSLDDQRAADLAYKRLGLELEPLSQTELERVQAVGHEGGLRVTAVNTDKIGERFVTPSDLLVGLHVWPIKSLQDVVVVLQRKDIHELSPLKFYAVRIGFGGGGGQRGGPSGDELVSGRIDVVTGSPFGDNPFHPRSAAATRPIRLAPGDRIKVMVTGAFPDQPIDNEYMIESMGTLPLGPTYGRVKLAGLTLLEAESAVKKQLGKLLTDVGVQITLVAEDNLKPLHAVLPGMSVPPEPTELSKPTAPHRAMAEIELRYAQAAFEVAKKEYISQRGRNPFGDETIPGTEIAKLRLAMQRAQLQVERAQIELDMKSQPKPGTSRQPILLYDNKTFDDWRSLWKNELKTEKRTEAIKALAAFGHAGYGKEAAEAILDVAGEYDFHSIDGGDEGRLKETVLAVLSAGNIKGIGPSLWLDDLLQRHTVDDKKWHWLACHAISRLGNGEQPLEEATYRTVFMLARGDAFELRRAAVEAINESIPIDDPRVRELAEELVAADDPEVAILGLNLATQHIPRMGGDVPPKTPIRSIAALLTALRHPSETVCRTARDRLQNASEVDAREVVIALIKALQAAESDQSRIKVVRALTALGKFAAPAETMLRELIADSISSPLQIAADVALRKLLKQPESIAEYNELNVQLTKIAHGDLFPRPGIEPTQQEILQREKLHRSYQAARVREEEAIFSENNEQAGGGPF